MSVYGGPGAKRIYNRYALNDGNQALAQLGFIVIAVDHRGISGHSYGGYLTCITLLKAPDVFHVGVAGAPVTDWRNYDKDLKGHLFIHRGAVDNNVHPGNSIQLIQALQKHNKIFDFMIYPEQRHGIRIRTYGESRVEYFVKHLRPDVK